jgi:hypothetical protein
MNIITTETCDIRLIHEGCLRALLCHYASFETNGVSIIPIDAEGKLVHFIPYHNVAEITYGDWRD